jgi:NDP-sugar pyrophosphorylase family protein
MNIIIPCSGEGSRFKSAGYNQNKPLIDVVDNKKIIDFVISMFDINNDNFIFITNSDNYQEIDEYLGSKNIINYNIDFIKKHKRGPVYTIIDSLSFIKDNIRDKEGIIISYCDYYQKFNYKNFIEFVYNEALDGCILSYTDYHPHLIPEKNVYASSLLGDRNRILEVMEKSFIGKKMNAYHSCGLYYFKNIDIIEKYFNMIIEKNNSINGEFYISLVYNLLINDNLRVKSFNTNETFLQLGTPEDLEYVKKQFEKNKNFNSFEDSITNIVLMAGRSKRFKDEGYTTQKSFLEINNQKLYKLQSHYFNKAVFKYITLEEYKHFINDKENEYIYIKPNKKGPAFSLFDSGVLNEKMDDFIITPCDVFCNYYTKEFVDIKNKYDIIVFGTKNHENSLLYPHQFSWIKKSNNDLIEVSLKNPLHKIPKKDDWMLIGSFYIKNADTFNFYLEKFLKTEPSVNEFYIDELINYIKKNSKLKIGTCLVDNYYSFGTPDEFLESKYWLEYFGEK